MRVGICQVDTWVGDLAQNLDCIQAAATAVQEGGPALIVFPELCVPGYPPRDLWFDPGFVADVLQANQVLAQALAGLPPVVVGSVAPCTPVMPGHPALHNAALVLHGGKVLGTWPKQRLPSGDVFFEGRWFRPGPPRPPLAMGKHRAGLLVCEDLWDPDPTSGPAARAQAAGATLLVGIHGSPFRQGVHPQRLAQAARTGLPTVYVNAVGAQDELIFDGRSFVTDARGVPIATLPAFEEAVTVVDLDHSGDPPAPEPARAELDLVHRALVLGIRSFCIKNGISRVVLGLSGGIDSTLVACLAAEALGPRRVTGIAMPSRYTHPASTEAAQHLAANLGIGFELLPIETLHEAAGHTLGAMLLDRPANDTTDENLQARLRMVLLMAWVNRHGGMLLNTSNKTELSLGYSTLYGDMAGALAPIADLTKPQVVALAGRIQAGKGCIPRFVLERPPTAELRPAQVDPFDYPHESPLIERAIQRGSDATDETARYRSLIRHSEHKRWQMGVVLKVSETAFGTGRMMPITRQR